MFYFFHLKKLANTTRIQALFRITTEGIPPLKKPSQWSTNFQDFLKQTVTQDPKHRPSAAQLLSVSKLGDIKTNGLIFYSQSILLFKVQRMTMLN